jgi:hypothetical protein
MEELLTLKELLHDGKIPEALQDAYDSALRKAALEAFEGRYAADKLGELVNRDEVIQEAMDLIFC